jgi:hypothetical protein
LQKALDSFSRSHDDSGEDSSNTTRQEELWITAKENKYSVKGDKTKCYKPQNISRLVLLNGFTNIEAKEADGKNGRNPN